MSRSRAEDFSYSDLGCLNGIYTNIMNKNVMLTATTLLENNAILQIKLHNTATGYSLPQARIATVGTTAVNLHDPVKTIRFEAQLTVK